MLFDQGKLGIIAGGVCFSNTCDILSLNGTTFPILKIGTPYPFPEKVINDFIAKHDAMRAMMRWSLAPLVGFSWIALRLGPEPALLLTLSLLVMLSAAVVVLSRRLRQGEWSF